MMTKEQLYLLVVAEECNEVAQRCSKAMRFGMDEVQPGQHLNNRERILIELNDLVGAIETLFDTDINNILDQKSIMDKSEKIEEYLKYSQALNQVKSD
jgi:hypothetical protein